MTLAELELETRTKLKNAKLDDPAFEARQLLIELLQIEATDLLLKSEQVMSSSTIDHAREWTKKRCDEFPLAYLSRRRGFYKHTFYVEPGVLIPRPETELLVTHALAIVQARQPPGDIAFADLGSGSGCVGLSVLSELPSSSRLYAVDVSPQAINVTRKNAEQLGLSGQVQCIMQDAVTWTPPQPLDFVLANPPYIAVGDPQLHPAVEKYEPALALFAAADGFEFLNSWAEWSARHLRPGGFVIFEIGSGQSARAQDIMASNGFVSIQSFQDLAGIKRVIHGQKL